MKNNGTRNYYTWVILALVLVFSLITPTSALAYEGLAVNSLAYVRVDTLLNLRSEPQGEIIGGIPDGEVVTILSKIDRDGYYKIRVNRLNLECYVYGEYLSPYYYFDDEDVSYEDIFHTTPTPEEDFTTSTIDGITKNAMLVVSTEYKLNLRDKPSLKGNRIKYLYKGDTLQVLSTKVENGYIHVRDMATNYAGYVDERYVTLIKWENENPSTSLCTCTCCKHCSCCKNHSW